MKTVSLTNLPRYIILSDPRKVPAKLIEQIQPGVQRWRFTVTESGHVYLVDTVLDSRGDQPRQHSVELHLPLGQPLPPWAEDCLEPKLITQAV